ncbi:MAG: hypothetical protein LUO93_02085, partial [Methanomicrobiales archaeon]|nr:hypothetical protein [Methanomicrobiales archaeon]
REGLSPPSISISTTDQTHLLSARDAEIRAISKGDRHARKRSPFLSNAPPARAAKPGAVA